MRRPTPEQLGLTAAEFRRLAALETPARIQRFLDRIPSNFEFAGETVLPVREVLKQRRAHCIEGAFVAACALWVAGERPLVMYLKAVDDYHHVITLFRRGRCWGAISKTNAVYLRYRDPIYRTVRELALSYAHEYANGEGKRTLRAFSNPFDLSRITPSKWVSSERDCWELHDKLYDLPHTRLMSSAQARHLAQFDWFQREAGKRLEHAKPVRAGRIAHWTKSKKSA